MTRREVGSKKEMRPGVWRVRLSKGYDPKTGKQRRVMRTIYGSSKDADTALAQLAYEMGRSATYGTSTTFNDFWPSFLARCQAKGLTKASIKNYTGHWRMRIQPRFGDTPMSSVTFGMVQSWLYTLPNGSAKGTMATLKRLLNCAVDVDIIDHNPLEHRHLDYPIKQYEPDLEPSMPWSVQEIGQAMERLEGCPIEPLFLVLIGGGLRVEEGLALTWSDLTFRGVTHMDGSDGLICHAAITKARTDEDGLKGPKNAFSRRLVPIPDPFASRLHEISGDGGLWTANGSAASRDWRLCFEEPSGKSQYRGRLYGLPVCKLKDMRSYHETLMQEVGALDTVNARLHGRSNVQTGYVHYLKPTKALDHAAEEYGAAFGPKRSANA